MEDYTIPVAEVSCEKMLAKIDLMWKNREKIAALLQARIPVMQEDIKRSVERALALSIPLNDKKAGNVL
jgi:hypothetical protein